MHTNFRQRRDDERKHEQSVYEDKIVAFYESALDAWYTTRFELDRALLALSSGAIGLFVTLLTTGGAHSITTAVFFFIATILFITTIIAILIIFRRNAAYLKSVIENPNTKRDAWLGRLDWTASISFILGVLFSAAIVITVLNEHSYTEDKTMATQKQNTSNTGKQEVKKSVDGASGLQPLKQTPAPQPSTKLPAQTGKKLGK